MYVIIVLFFFKQKTAYEMRISDWSSDVCSSDLSARRKAAVGAVRHPGANRRTDDLPVLRGGGADDRRRPGYRRRLDRPIGVFIYQWVNVSIARRGGDRKSVV